MDWFGKSFENIVKEILSSEGVGICNINEDYDILAICDGSAFKTVFSLFEFKQAHFLDLGMPYKTYNKKLVELVSEILGREPMARYVAKYTDAEDHIFFCWAEDEFKDEVLAYLKDRDMRMVIEKLQTDGYLTNWYGKLFEDVVKEIRGSKDVGIINLTEDNNDYMLSAGIAFETKFCFLEIKDAHCLALIMPKETGTPALADLISEILKIKPTAKYGNKSDDEESLLFFWIENYFEEGVINDFKDQKGKKLIKYLKIF